MAAGNTEKRYIAIDLKSFYASVEARERGRDPLTTNIVVADVSRTEKTICLAVSPALKAYGIPGRARLFEVVRRVEEVNRERLSRLAQLSRTKKPAAGSRGIPGAVPGAGPAAAPGTTPAFSGESDDALELAKDPSLKVSYIAAVPRMSLYMDYSARIYQIYLKYVAPEDIFAYSIDEVFIDATDYLAARRLSAHELAMKMMKDVLRETGITATAGIGTNMYLAKIAMDIMAKRAKPDADGVRIAELDEKSYRRQLWDHRPLTDFWRVGKGTARKLESSGLFTMGDVAQCSVKNEDILYSMLGVNAELLIDHAWGWEPCTMDLVKAYVPEDQSFSSGQVLSEPYTYEKARVVVHEMAEASALDLVEKRMATNQVVLTVCYEKLSAQPAEYRGETADDWYGRKVPKHAHGTENLERYTSSGRLLSEAVLKIYDRTVDKNLLVRRIYLAVEHVLPEEKAREKDNAYEQLSLFTDWQERAKKEKSREKERKAQEAMLEIRRKYGKNAILKGLNFEEGATGRERNRQRGGHRE